LKVPVLKWYKSQNPRRKNQLEAYDPAIRGLRYIEINWPEDLSPELVKQWQANGKQGTFAREGPVRIPKRTNLVERTTQGKLGLEIAEERSRGRSQGKSP